MRCGGREAHALLHNQMIGLGATTWNQSMCAEEADLEHLLDSCASNEEIERVLFGNFFHLRIYFFGADQGLGGRNHAVCVSSRA